MKVSKSIAFISAFLMLVPSSSLLPVTAADAYNMAINIDLGGERKEISPYIYGVNEYGNQSVLKSLNVNAIREGGNRMTGYNWENNASNAGSDWKHSSDNNLSDSDAPADCVQTVSKEAADNGIAYKLATVQLAGYVAADKKGTVTEAEAAPSERWNEVVFTKGAPFADTPDLTDGKVYMDEYVNYIVGKLGDSQSATGIQGYSLDNEPALWNDTHSRMHANPITIAEMAEKSIAAAKAVKSVDQNAEIFGPALYGYTAFDHLDDDENSDEWEKVKEANGYHWYLDCYLDQMKKASEEYGSRLLDVLDIHYYSESARNGAVDRLQSVRTLYEKGFSENSWIGQWCMENVPILPTIQKSIDTYYPDTKLAISEYNFGGGDMSGTIAQAEALGCYADAGVYFATLWDGDEYIYSGIRLYTNYDGNNSTFGDTLIPTVTEDVSKSSAYAAVNGKDDGFVTAVVTNKDMNKPETAVISLDNAKSNYKAAAVYAVSGTDTDIRLIDIVDDIKDNKLTVELPAYSAATIVITDDASDLKGLEIYDPSKITQKTETFENLDEMINENGYVQIPISDPEHLKRITITADTVSEHGSAWGGAGCAVCMNCKDENGTGFWTYKDFQLNLGSNVSASVEFDGTLMNDEVEVKGVIADGKIELQKWWDYSEKQDEDIDDPILVNYKKVEVLYETVNNQSSESTTTTSTTTTTTTTTSTSQPDGDKLMGDTNTDGVVDISDVILLARYTAEQAGLPITKKGLANADMNADGKYTAEDVIKIIRRIALLDD